MKPLRNARGKTQDMRRNTFGQQPQQKSTAAIMACWKAAPSCNAAHVSVNLMTVRESKI